MKVSIVMPTYNGARYLSDAVASCLSQTWPDLELIIVIDGSSDHTREILDVVSDRRVRIIEHDTNKGLAESINTGMAASSGELLTWTSDDNLYLPHAIEKMAITLAERPDVDFIYAGNYLIDDDGRITDVVPALGPERLWEKDVIGACFLYRRVVWEQTGRFNPARRNIEDYEYWLRVSRRFRMSAEPEILYKYREHPLSLTGRLNVFERARQSAEMKHDLGGISFKRLQQELAEIDIAAAFERYQSGCREDVPRLVFSGLRRNPAYAANRGVWSILVRSLLK